MILRVGTTPICVSGVSSAEKREKIKHVCRNNGPRFSKFDEIYKRTDLSHPMCPGTRNKKKTTPNNIIMKVTETTDTQKIQRQ